MDHDANDDDSPKARPARRRHDGDTPRPVRPITPEWLFRAAAHYLERYASSTENLRRVLKRKIMRRAALLGEDPSAHAGLVETTVARFVDLKLLDDRSFAEGFLATQNRRGTSRRMAAAKLGQKGIDRDLVDSLMPESETGERDAARAYAKRRRLGPFRIREREERRDRDIAAMMRAGFSFSDAKAAVDSEAEPE